jgi:hypothetical protein
VSATQRFQFEKHPQFFIRMDNEALSVVPVYVNNPDPSPLAIYRRNTNPTPSSFTKIVRDDFHACRE